MGERRAEIVDRIERACRKAGRDASEITVTAVSKTVDVDAVVAAWRSGYRVFAENRPQELARKAEILSEDPEMGGIRFDMIGNLQTNKINQVLAHATLIHSISSAHLAEAVSRRAAAKGKVAPVLLEVNVSGEDSKSGFSPDEALRALDGLSELDGISIEGLMTMAPAGMPDVARTTFSGLRELRDRMRAVSDGDLAVLSCGMSDDFEIAVEEGSTLVRLGRVVFDQRYAPVEAK